MHPSIEYLAPLCPRCHRLLVPNAPVTAVWGCCPPQPTPCGLVFQLGPHRRLVQLVQNANGRYVEAPN